MQVLRWFVITVSTVVLTTLGINAYDNRDELSRSMVGAAFSAIGGKGETGPCPKGMAFVGASGGGYCIDAYEASPSETCTYTEPSTKQQSSENLTLPDCKPVSEAEKIPWRNISRDQAELACARAGKRLPSTAEWYRAALGTPDPVAASGGLECNIGFSGAAISLTGERTQCVSPSGAYDMIGNVWEWAQETVSNNTLNGKTLPEQGYITGIDSDGVPIATSIDTADPSFFSDFFWADPTEVRGILRGGYWNSQSDGGQYAMNVAVPPMFSGEAVGFRCVKDVQP